ncbi:hypothetical protein RJD39_03945 [Vibrio scophthalmi]|uniref:hypothetical protein n=1 Tax=Vibrio scophthalmi TaxID=45658 RepID=UPI0038735C6B
MLKINKLTLALFGVATATVAQASFVSIIRLDNVSVASVSGEEIDYTSWVNVHEPYDCTTWSPLTDTVKLGENFEQKRDCNQDQERIKSVYRVWDNGNKTLISQDIQSQTLINNENQDATGTRNDVDDTRIGDWSDWTDVGALHSCSSWSPLVTAINHGTGFTQTADCSQDQERTRNIYNVWTDGSETLKNVETDDKTIDESKSQQATGIKDYILSQVEGPWSDWTDFGALHTCGAWSPLTNTVLAGFYLDQSQTCNQDQERTRTIYDDWKLGENTVNRVETENQSTVSEKTQNVEGTRAITRNELDTLIENGDDITGVDT